MQADGGLEVHEVGFSAGLHDLGVGAAILGEALPGVRFDAVEAQALHPVDEAIIMQHDAAALAGGQVLVGVEAVDAHD